MPTTISSASPGISATATPATARRPSTRTATATVTDGFGGSAASSVSVPVTYLIAKATAAKKKFALNFKTGKDGIDITLSNADFSNSVTNPAIKFIVGDVLTNNGVTVDSGTLSKNKATSSVGKFTVNTRAGTARYATTKASLQALLLPYGAVNGTTTATLTIPIYINFNNGFYGDTFTFSYVGVAGKTGKAK